MIVVTGAAGFIGSNIVKGLNKQGHTNIIAVDDLTQGEKYANLADCQLADYLDKQAFKARIENNHSFKNKIQVIFHQGACSDTTCWDGKYMMEENFEYSKVLVDYCAKHDIPFIYASSAAVYGCGESFQEHPSCEKPLNVYGYSKLLFDQYVRRLQAQNQIVGLRYFNVFGYGESHKGKMASTAFHFYHQADQNNVVKLFAGCDGYQDGMQMRDFVFIEDVVNVNLWLMEHPEVRGIFNVGTGVARTFNDMAKAVLSHFPKAKIEYIPFPEHLKGHYQSYTQADISKLRQSGYTQDFNSLEQGVTKYCKALTENH